MLCMSVIVVLSLHRSIGVDRRVSEPAMTGAAPDPGPSTNFRYTTSTAMTPLVIAMTEQSTADRPIAKC